MEALAAKEAKAEKEAEKKAKLQAWKDDKRELHQAVR